MTSSSPDPDPTDAGAPGRFGRGHRHPGPLRAVACRGRRRGADARPRRRAPTDVGHRGPHGVEHPRRGRGALRRGRKGDRRPRHRAARGRGDAAPARRHRDRQPAAVPRIAGCAPRERHRGRGQIQHRVHHGCARGGRRPRRRPRPSPGPASCETRCCATSLAACSPRYRCCSGWSPPWSPSRNARPVAAGSACTRWPGRTGSGRPSSTSAPACTRRHGPTRRWSRRSPSSSWTPTPGSPS